MWTGRKKENYREARKEKQDARNEKKRRKSEEGWQAMENHIVSLMSRHQNHAAPVMSCPQNHAAPLMSPYQNHAATLMSLIRLRMKANHLFYRTTKNPSVLSNPDAQRESDAPQPGLKIMTWLEITFSLLNLVVVLANFIRERDVTWQVGR